MKLIIENFKIEYLTFLFKKKHETEGPPIKQNPTRTGLLSNSKNTSTTEPKKINPSGTFLGGEAQVRFLRNAFLSVE